jgi:hypothetical protein
MKTLQADRQIRQFINESEEWRRLLTFLKQQNVFYKSALSEIVSNVDDDEILSMAEEFNDEFISLDRMVDFLSAELKNQTRLLEANINENNGMFKQIINYQKKLRSDICIAEELTMATKKRFCLYFTDVL